MTARPLIDVRIVSPRWARLAAPARLIRRAITAAAARTGHATCSFEVAVTLADDDRLAELNRVWRGRDGPTNVLSFPAAPSPGLPDAAPRPLGDIVLAAGLVARQAGDQGKSLAAHVAHLVVHGFLHLVGHTHDDAGDAARMERIEVAVMADLGFPDPYREPVEAHG